MDLSSGRGKIIFITILVIAIVYSVAVYIISTTFYLLVQWHNRKRAVVHFEALSPQIYVRDLISRETCICKRGYFHNLISWGWERGEMFQAWEIWMTVSILRWDHPEISLIFLWFGICTSKNISCKDMLFFVQNTGSSNRKSLQLFFWSITLFFTIPSQPYLWRINCPLSGVLAWSW